MGPRREGNGRADALRAARHGPCTSRRARLSSGDFAYPITADPWWNTAWKVTQCVFAITYVALTTVFIVGKALKLVRAIQAARHWVASVGGARSAANLLVGASTSAERGWVLSQARNIAGASVLDFFGITQIRQNCF